MEGQRISSYRVVRKIGQGGMGAVYEAVHEQLGRKAAIKLLRKELSQDPQIAMRFLNEGRAASRIEHSGIVQIFEFGHLPDGTAYIIMEFLRGDALSTRLRSMGGKLPLADTIRISRQIASALAAAHAKGIIHRDLKPDNVMLVPDSEMPGGERVKILDFGVAKVIDYSGPGSEDYKTNTGMVLGTASYMAPEQCKGAGSVSDKADVYSLGIVMYRMLVGHLPFRAEGQGEVMAMHIFSKARPLREIDPSVPEPMAALVERMMEKEQTERPSMALVAGELERLTGKLTPGGQPVMVMVSGGALTSGQHPTAPTLSVPTGPNNNNSSNASVEPAVTQPDPPRRRFGLLSAALVLLMLGGGVAAGMHYGLLRPILALVHPPPTPPPPPLAPVMVSWSLSSVPDKAQVIRKSDGVVLGTTGWFHQQPKGPGKLVVILRAPGYQDLEVTFDENIDMSRHESLTLLPPPDLGGGQAAPAAPPDMAAAAAVTTTAPPQPGTTTTQPGTPPRNPLGPRPPKKGRNPSTAPTQGALTDDDVAVFKD